VKKKVWGETVPTAYNSESHRHAQIARIRITKKTSEKKKKKDLSRRDEKEQMINKKEEISTQKQ